jgi:hypothetical protein
MRLALGLGLGFGGGLRERRVTDDDFRFGPRPYFSLPETPHNYRYLNPGRDFIKNRYECFPTQKTPLQQPTREGG